MGRPPVFIPLEDRIALADLYREGFSLNECAEVIGHSTTIVRRTLLEFGVEMRPPGRPSGSPNKKQKRRKGKGKGRKRAGEGDGRKNNRIPPPSLEPEASRRMWRGRPAVQYEDAKHHCEHCKEPIERVEDYGWVHLAVPYHSIRKRDRRPLTTRVGPLCDREKAMQHCDHALRAEARQGWLCAGPGVNGLVPEAVGEGYPGVPYLDMEADPEWMIGEDWWNSPEMLASLEDYTLGEAYFHIVWKNKPRKRHRHFPPGYAKGNSPM